MRSRANDGTLSESITSTPRSPTINPAFVKPWMQAGVHAGLEFYQLRPWGCGHLILPRLLAEPPI